MLSEELIIARMGNFTASENHRLMAGWDAITPNRNFPEFDNLYGIIKPLYDGGQKKFLVGDIKELVGFKVTGKMINDTLSVIRSEEHPAGLVTYAEEKALEELFEPDPSLNFSTQHTINGEEREIECMELLAAATGLNFVHTGDFQTHIHADQVGCTPDGVVLDDLDMVETGAEVKCKSPLVHARNLLINTAADMKDMAFEHYVQIQTAMLVTGALHWYFANYNPYAKTDELKFKHIVIERDEEFIKILKKRINLAKKIKLEFKEKVLAATNPNKKEAE